MKKIPTAEEFMNLYHGSTNKHALIEFAKLHVEAALKAASEEADYITDGQEHITDVWIDKDSILKSYPLDNIK